MSAQGMRVVLEGPLEVDCYDVFAEMAWVEQRPEVTALCGAGVTNGGTISLEVIESSLPGLSRRAAHNVRGWLEELGLCTRDGSLTKLGRLTAETGDVAVPEQGVYRLWVVDHRLTGRRVLHASRQAPERDHRFDEIQRLPVEPEHDTPFQSVLDRDARVVVRGFPSNHGHMGCLPQRDASKIRIRWDWDMQAGTESWRADGNLDVGRLVGASPIEGQSGDDPWALLAYLGREAEWGRGRWDRDARALVVRFEEVEGDAVERFVGDARLKVARVRGFEAFSEVRVHSAPLEPADEACAQSWAEERLRRRLEKPRARSRESVRRLWSSLVEDTPLEPHQPCLPSHDELLSQCADRPAHFWALAAPVDLAPVETPADALGEMWVGEPADEPVAQPDIVRIPHGARWSMETLLAHIFPTQEVSRVILVDRYVRGTANVAALTALAEAVRQMGAVLQVCTDLDGQGIDAGAIRAITGTPTLAYRQVFGQRRRNQPHDRYLIGSSASNVAIWQFSNSPLDGRWGGQDAPSPETPLRWRDLIAARCELEQVPAALTALVGGTK